MSMELPESFYNEGRQRRLGLSRLRGWSILLIMFCIWNLFTPWGLIRRNRISAEFPNSEFGIQRAFITEERELVIERRGYVDRMSKYTYGPAGEFAELAEAELFTGVHVDSNPSISSTYRTEGVGFDIKPGSLTLEKIRRSSLRLRYRFFLDGELALDARMTTACIDMDRLKSCELPAAYRAAFQALAPDTP